jgi:hypothetical protein
VDLCVFTPNAHMLLLNALMRTVCQEVGPVTILDGTWGLIKQTHPDPTNQATHQVNHTSLKRNMKS